MNNPVSLFEKIIEELNNYRPVALVTITEKEGSGPRDPGTSIVLTIDGRKYGTIGGGSVERIIVEKAMEALKQGVPQKIKIALRQEKVPEDAVKTDHRCGGVVEVFVNVITPPPRIIMAGAGNVGKPIADIANMLGYKVIVIDSNPELANRERYPYAEEIVVGNIPGNIAKYASTKYDIAIIAYGDVETDYQSLRKLVEKKFEGHIWVLCSRTRATWMLKRLIEEGYDLEDMIDRIHMPAGLDIGSDSPEEIAVSILAEIICTLRKCRTPVKSLDISKSWWNSIGEKLVAKT